MIAENTARACVDGGKYSTMSFYDLITKPQTTKTGQQIVDELTQRMGLEVIDDRPS